MKTSSRFFTVAWIFFKILLDFRKEIKLTRKKGFNYAQKKMEKTHKKRARQLYNISVKLGGVLIKFCQYLSTRRDFLPTPYIETLSPLQDNVPPASFEAICTVLEKEYGTDYKNNFKSIDPVPLASASLGQTHRAVLHDGTDAVLKVLKPGIEKTIDLDFAIIYNVFSLFSNFKIFQQKADFFGMLKEFIKVTGDELNFKREVHISKEFKKRLAKFSFVKIPYVYEELSTQRIIVMEFVKGDKISDVEKWEKRNNSPVILARRIVELYIEQFLFLKLIHFDPHPGNILITEDNNIILLDFGMSGEITEAMSSSIKGALKAFAVKDYRKILDIMEKLGLFRKGADKNSLLSIMEYFFDEVMDTIKLEKESIQTVDLSPIIDELAELVYNQPLQLPVEWAFIGRTIGTLVGIISSLNPDFKIYDELLPYAQRAVQSNIKEIAQESFETLKEDSKILFNLPSRIDRLIEGVERKRLKFRVDFEEVDEKIDDFRTVAIKSVGFIITFLSAITTYVLFFYYNANNHYIVFGIFTIIAFIYSFTYKKRSRKELIKRQFFR